MTKANLTKTSLRQRAEAKLSKHKKSLATETDSKRLVHELQVHQIELEMQNEELVQARAESEAAHRQYVNLYDFAPVGYFTLARDGAINRVNVAGATLLGVERGELVKRRMGLYVSYEFRLPFNAFIDKVFTSGKNEAYEIELLKGGTAPFWAHLEATTDNAERETCRLVMADISERKRAEEKICTLNAELEQRVQERTRELRDAQAQLVIKEKLAVLGQLADGVGHELSKPLTVINNAVYYLKLVETDADEKVRQYHALIEQEVHMAEKIINDLLDFAYAAPPDREPVSVPKLVNRVLEHFPLLPSVEVELKLCSDLPKVYADSYEIEQALGNLVENAFQSMILTIPTGAPSGGKLTISARQQKKMVAITVKDTGMGITRENMNRLFEPLFTTKNSGVGLGLAVSKKLVDANDGRIEVQSDLGKGSMFTIYLPILPSLAG